jgi:hypothetical protein
MDLVRFLIETHLRIMARFSREWATFQGPGHVVH